MEWDQLRRRRKVLDAERSGRLLPRENIDGVRVNDAAVPPIVLVGVESTVLQ